MSNLLKRELFIQAVVIGDSEDFKIQVSETEYQSSAFITYINLGKTSVQFECNEITVEDIKEFKKTQLQQLKDNIMATAEKQCNDLGG